MTEQEINKVIAEHAGWRRAVDWPAGEFEMWISPSKSSTSPTPPPYFSSLDALHEALQSLTEVELFRYADEVCDLAYDGSHDTDIQQLLTMEAKDLAACYVRAIGKWKEKK